MWRLLVLLALLPLLEGRAQEPEGASAPVVRIVTTDFVLPAKFQRMVEWAAAAGYRLEWRDAETPGSVDVATGASLLVFDGPRPIDRAAIEQAVGPFDQLDTVPWILVGGGPPAFRNLPPEAARTLIGYYANGGAANLKAFVAAIPRVLTGGSLAELPPPQALPATGLYHPQADRLFASPQAYQAWIEARGGTGRPIVAVAIPSGAIGDMQTAVIDTLAERIEAQGLVPALFWYEESDPQALSRVVTPLNAQVLVNLTHMQNEPARVAELEQLDIPVLQALSDRSATPAQWRAATTGIAGGVAAVMLSVPERWGISDPIVVGAVEQGRLVPIAEQVELLAGKLARLTALRRTAAADKRLVLFFWNYPAGEKNLSASNLNVPRSLARLTRDLADAGYRVPTQEESVFIAAGQAMLGGHYRPETLDALLERGLAAQLPVSAYQAWLASLPAARRAEILTRWGPPETHPAVREGHFVIPRLELGNLLVLPQPPRGDDASKSYHDQKVPPDHRYLATYLWVRQHARADAIIHFGTHGTQEWTPGKDRGLWAADYPFLLLGDVPVFYPYIQDNVAEAIQARRRGRAVTVSHQTPPFAPSGLYEELLDIHALIHEYAQLEQGPVRERVAAEIRERAVQAHLSTDMGWSREAMEDDFPGFFAALHDHLHQLARTSVPLGLHVFGEATAPEHRLTTVLQQLGPEYLEALGMDPNESFAEDVEAIRASEPYRVLERYLREGEDTSDIDDPALRALIERAAAFDRHLAQPDETEALLAGLAGRFVRAGPGGDPIRNPQVPSGRNLYAFEAEKVPTPAAYAEGGKALDDLIAAYREKHRGELPRKLAFSMFSGETIRTLGVGEGQILHALGLKPVWDRGGRVERLEIIPQGELGRPRIDVVVQATSVYRDQFDVFMRQLAEAIERIAELDEQAGPAAHARALEVDLRANGIPVERARQLSRLRIFSNAPGDYGTGLPDQIIKEAGWGAETELAEPFLERLQYAYGARDWGVKGEGANLLAEQLRDVDAAVLMRSSHVHGLLSTDHPFEHLGGLSLAIRHLTGRSPDLFVTDMRAGAPRIATAGAFLANELRARYLNPQWISAMQAEGYAGATTMVGIVNNVWGWQVVDPGSVRADQWQAIHDVYVMDKYALGLREWFEQHHPTAQVQLLERLVEAIRRDFWDAPEHTRREIAQRWQALADQNVVAGDEETHEFARQMMAGFGLSSGAAPRPEATSAHSEAPSAPPTAAPERVRGQVMQAQPPPLSPPEPWWRRWLGLLVLMSALAVGAVSQLRHHTRFRLDFNPS